MNTSNSQQAMTMARPKIVAFRPSPGHTVTQAQATVYGEELVRIERVYGNLENRTIWTASQAPASPLHDAFEWDNRTAADKFRDEQARKLKQSIEVEIRFVDGHTATAPLTIALQRTEIEVQRGNRTPLRVETIVRVLSNKQKVEQMLEEAMEQLAAWRERYRCLEEISQVWKAVDVALRKQAGRS